MAARKVLIRFGVLALGGVIASVVNAAPPSVRKACMLLLVFFFTWIGLKQARRNDQLIAQGRTDEILKEMQK